MKRICLITHKLKKGDGQGRVNYEIVRAACGRGYDVTILASECAPEVVEKMGAKFVEIRVDPWFSQFLRNQVFAFRSFLWLKKNGADFDIIHSNGFITWYSANINAAHFVHGAWLRSEYNNDRFFAGIKSAYHKSFTILNALLEKRAFRQAKTVIAVSPLVVEELCSIGVSRQKIVMIPNGVDIDEFHPGKGLRSELRIGEAAPLAIFSGDLRSRRKNLETVLTALREATAWHLLVLSRVEGSEYPALALEMGISDRVHFLGFRRDSPELMRSADILVFPSRYDPCTLVVAEALASGVPVITASTVGAAFQVPEGAGWVLDDPEDGAEIARLLTIVANQSRKERTDASTCARAVAVTYAWSKTAQAHLTLYDAIVNETKIEQRVSSRNSPGNPQQ